MADTDTEVRKVVAELDALLDRLSGNVDALNSILAGHNDQQEEGAPA